MTLIPLFFDSRKGQGKSEDFITSFNPPLQLDINKSYEISLTLYILGYFYTLFVSRGGQICPPV